MLKDIHTHTHTYSCAMVQALCRRSVNAEARVQLQISLCGICGRHTYVCT